MEQLLAEMESAEGATPGERDLEFRLDPTRVRQTLASLVKADPQLWLKHLLQLLYDVELARPTLLSRLSDDRLRLTFVLAQAEVEQAMRVPSVYEQQAWLMAPHPAAQMARILAQIPGPAAYRHGADADLTLRTSPDGFWLDQSGGYSESGIALDFPIKSLLAAPRIFGHGPRSIGRLLQPIASLNPWAPIMQGMDPLAPDWPFRAPVHDSDSDVPTLWDWESVVPTSGKGFPWTVSAWGEPLPAADSSARFSVLRHPIELKRSFSTLPLMGCYPPGLAEQIGVGPSAERALLTVRAQRVFGISWTTSAPDRSELFPIIRGVPAAAIVMEGVPAGLYILADASHLRTDASGVALVRDDAMEAWMAELIEWAKGQTELYAPYMSAIPRMWIARVKRWEDVGKPPGAWQKFWQTAMSGLFSVAPVQGLIDRRAATLTAWTRR